MWDFLTESNVVHPIIVVDVTAILITLVVVVEIHNIYENIN